MSITTDFFEHYLLSTAYNAVQGAFNQGRMEGVKTFAAEGAQYSAILDDRCCDACEALDGMELNLRTEMGQVMFDKYSPAQHERCRCTWIYLLAGDPDIPDPEDNRKFQQTFIDRYNRLAGGSDTLADIACKHMRHNVFWDGYPQENPWAEEIPEIISLIREADKLRKEKQQRKQMKALMKQMLKEAEDAE